LVFFDPTSDANAVSRLTVGSDSLHIKRFTTDGTNFVIWGLFFEESATSGY